MSQAISANLQAIVAKKLTLDVFIPAYTPKLTQPQLNMDVSLQAGPHGAESDRCEVTVKLTAKLGEAPVYTAVAVFEALASFVGLSQAQRAELREPLLANQIFPYIRQALSGLVSQAGFPAPLLPLMQAAPRSSAPQLPANDAALPRPN